MTSPGCPKALSSVLMCFSSSDLQNILKIHACFHESKAGMFVLVCGVSKISAYMLHGCATINGASRGPQLSSFRLSFCLTLSLIPISLPLFREKTDGSYHVLQNINFHGYDQFWLSRTLNDQWQCLSALSNFQNYTLQVDAFLKPTSGIEIAMSFFLPNLSNFHMEDLWLRSPKRQPHDRCRFSAAPGPVQRNHHHDVFMPASRAILLD